MGTNQAISIDEHITRNCYCISFVCVCYTSSMWICIYACLCDCPLCLLFGALFCWLLSWTLSTSISVKSAKKFAWTKWTSTKCVSPLTWEGSMKTAATNQTKLFEFEWNVLFGIVENQNMSHVWCCGHTDCIHFISQFCQFWLHAPLHIYQHLIDSSDSDDIFQCFSRLDTILITIQYSNACSN